MKLVSAFLTFALMVTAQARAEKIVLYSSYDGERLAPILAPFTERTGIAVEVVNAGSEELVNKLEAEGLESPADLYLDKDIVYLGSANKKGLLQSFNSEAVTSNIPSHLISKDNRWLLIFYRARTLMYNTDKVNPADLKNLEDLGDAKWAGQVCVRTSKNSYNQALAAFMVKHFGETKAISIFESWVKNFSGEPLKGDRDVIHAIAKGECLVGIANTYYLAPIVRDDATFPVGIVFPEQSGVGAHINGVGIGITKSSKKVAEANLFLEFLALKEVQEAIAGGFSQYPSSRQAEVAPILKQIGSFIEDTTNVDDIAQSVEAGNEAMLKGGYK